MHSNQGRRWLDMSWLRWKGSTQQYILFQKRTTGAPHGDKRLVSWPAMLRDYINMLLWIERRLLTLITWTYPCIGFNDRSLSSCLFLCECWRCRAWDPSYRPWLPDWLTRNEGIFLFHFPGYMRSLWCPTLPASVQTSLCHSGGALQLFFFKKVFFPVFQCNSGTQPSIILEF